MERNRCSIALQLLAAAAMTCCGAQAVRAQLRNFAPASPATYRTGGASDDAPFAVTVADLDGDGNLDIVTCNVGTSTVSVRLGNGDGTFKAEAQYSVGSGPRSVAVGDVNGDGVPDIITANGNGNSVSVLLGNPVPMSMPVHGDGTFAPRTDYATGVGPVTVVIADMNGDGIPDLVTANTGTPDPITHVLASSVSVLLGQAVPMSMPAVGDGTFPTHVEKSTPPAPSSMVVGDFDGDGKQDVITANLGKLGAMVTDTFSFLQGNGDGTLNDPQNFSGGFLGPRSLTAAYLNADGNLDLVVTYPGARLNPTDPPGLVGVMLGNGNGTFQPATFLPAVQAPVAVTVGDFDNDGKLDILTANLGPQDNSGIPFASTVSVLLGNGDGTFQPAQYFPLPVPPTVTHALAPQALALGNFNGDGFPDLVVATAAEVLGSEVPTPKIHFADARAYVALNIPNTPPTAVCQDVTVSTGANDCSANVTAQQVNNGSFDADFGDTITLSLSPAGPYGPGVHNVTLTVTDNHRASSSCPATITVLDQTKPIVTLTGDSSITVECHTSFTDPGATAMDNCSGVLSVTVGGSVDVNTPGTYMLTYSATDASMNTGTASRTVIVKDTTPPVITLIGGNPITVECHTSFTDPGATASDTCKGDLTGAIMVTGNVDVNTPGTYILTYTVSDGVNTATKKRTVTVRDTLPPTVTLIGPADITIECHGVFTDPGATATDACAGPQFVNVGGIVNPNVTGDYTLTYFATDPSGNVGQTTRTVHVRDTIAPTIGPVTLSRTTLSPVNGKLLPVTVSYNPTDSCGGITSWLTVTSSDPDSGTGGNDLPNDIQIVDEHHVALRAERSGKMRTYTITVHCSDGTNVSTATATVTVGK